MKIWAKKIFLFLGSLKFAVIVILSLAVISAVGTIVESKYNTEIAQTIVYRSPYMYLLLIAFSISILFSTLIRWPWQRKHIPFLTAHLGILILIYGSFLTMRYGIDGTLTIPLSESNQWVSVSEKEIEVYASFDGQKYVSLYKGDGEFYKNRPNKNPIVIPTEEGEIRINDYIPFALKNSRVIPTDDENFGPALRFSLSNEMVNVNEWILQRGNREANYALGPAKIILSKDGTYKPETRGNYLVLSPGEKDRLNYVVYYEKNLTPKRGSLKIGEEMDTGWMNLKFHLLQFLPQAKEKSDFTARPYPSERTSPAIRIQYQGEDYWQEINSLLRIFTATTAYIVSWRNEQIDIGFPIRLKEFRLGKYPGTNRAASYASLVEVPNLGEIEISMNEPLQHNGFTFYQASFQQDPSGEPTATVLSVNYDPGRFLKYLGSLLIVLGSVLLFYFRRYYMRKKV